MKLLSRFLNRYALASLVLVVGLPVSALAIAPSHTFSLIKSGAGTVSSAIQTLMVRGSVLINGGQIVLNNNRNANSGLVYGTQGFDIPAKAKDTGSGGLAKYDTILLPSPFNSTAATRGLRTGTGIVRWAVLSIIANPNASPIDCSKVSAAGSGTGGTALFTDVTATGTTISYNTPFVLGPTESIKCGTSKTPTASFSGTLLTGNTQSDVLN